VSSCPEERWLVCRQEITGSSRGGEKEIHLNFTFAAAAEDADAKNKISVTRLKNQNSAKFSQKLSHF